MSARSTGRGTSVVVHTSESDSLSVQSTTATGAVPALTRGNSTASSAGSADTGLASALDNISLLSTHNGVLEAPNRYLPNADLICPFQILDCEVAFSDIRLWKNHVFFHFKGHPCPKTATCFLCDKSFMQRREDRPDRAWNEMLSHLANDHYRRGQRLATVRTDFSLMRWMYNRRIITDAEFKRTQLCPVPRLQMAGSRLSEVVNVPEAPAPPNARQVRLVQPGAHPGYQDEPYTQQSTRAERRLRNLR